MSKGFFSIRKQPVAQPTGHVPAANLLLACIFLVYPKREYALYIGEVYKEYTRKPCNSINSHRIMMQGNFGQITLKLSNSVKTVKFCQNSQWF